VQILNTAVFEKITGLPAPPCPITAETYRQHGYPYYAIYDDEHVPGISGDFAGIKSVNEIDKTKHGENAKATVVQISKVGKNPVILLDAAHLKRPFRHVTQLEAEVRATDVVVF